MEVKKEMRKLFLILVLISAFSVSAMGAEGDTVKCFLTGSLWTTFPFDAPAPTYDFRPGLAVTADYKISRNVTVAVSYVQWGLNGESAPDIKGDFLGGRVSLWFFDLGSSDFNMCWIGSGGYNRMIKGDSEEESSALMSGLGAIFRVYKGIYLRGNCTMGKYGGEEGDVVGIDVGLSFKL